MSRLPLFAGVNPVLVESMLKCAYLQRFPAHVELAREGDCQSARKVDPGSVSNIDPFVVER
jgi:hypothetical protein